MSERSCIISSMSEQAQGAICHWFFSDTKEKNQGTIHELIKQLQTDTPCYFLLPCGKVNHLSVNVTEKTRDKILNALPFALEEQLVSDIENNHFVPFHQSKDQVAVSVIVKDEITRVIAFAKHYHLSLRGVFALELCLPSEHDAWTIVCEQDAVYCRMSEQHAFSTNWENSLLFLKAACSDFQQPSSVNLIGACDSQRNIIIDTLTGLGVKKIISDEHPIQQWIIDCCNQDNEANFLQGSYAVTNSYSLAKRLWLASGIIGLLCLGIIVFGSWYRYHQLITTTEKLDATLLSLYQKVYPNAKRVTSPRLVLQRELDSTPSMISDQFFVLLAQVGRHISEKPEITLNTLSFQRQQLLISIDVNDFSILENIITALHKAGLLVKQESAISHGDKVQARLSIRSTK